MLVRSYQLLLLISDLSSLCNCNVIFHSLATHFILSLRLLIKINVLCRYSEEVR